MRTLRPFQIVRSVAPERVLGRRISDARRARTRLGQGTAVRAHHRIDVSVR